MNSSKSCDAAPRFFMSDRASVYGLVFSFAALFLLAPLAAKPVVSFAGGLCALFSFAGLWRAKQAPDFHDPSFIIPIGIVFMVGISALWSIAPDAALSTLPRLILILGGGAALIAYARLCPLAPVAAIRILPIAFLCGIVLVFLMQLSDFAVFGWWLQEEEVPAHLGNKALGVYALLAPAVFAPLYKLGGELGRKAVGVLAVFLIFIATQSEGQSALFALFVAALCFFLPVSSRWFFQFFRLVLVGGILGAPIIAMVLFGFAHELDRISFFQWANGPERLEVWRAVAQKIFDRPLFGYGYEATRYISAFETREIFQPGTTFSHPHNMALQFWIEFGAAGAAAGAAALFAVVRAIERSENLFTRRLYLASFSATVSVSLVGWGLWQGWWMMLVILIVVANITAGRMIGRSSVNDIAGPC